MSCPCHAPRSRARPVMVAVACALAAHPAAAQAPVRPPIIQLVQPAEGSSVPVDHPVVVLRFFTGEPADPIDLGTFRVAVDGEDRTALFHLTGGTGSGEGWGPLGSASAPGAHLVAARVCSLRGICATTQATVTVAAPPAAAAIGAPSGGAASVPRSIKRRIVDALLQGARALLH